MTGGDVECCGICRYVRPAKHSPGKLVCRRYAPRSEWRTGAKLLSVPIVEADDWCGEFDPRPPPQPARILAAQEKPHAD